MCADHCDEGHNAGSAGDEVDRAVLSGVQTT